MAFVAAVRSVPLYSGGGGKWPKSSLLVKQLPNTRYGLLMYNICFHYLYLMYNMLPQNGESDIIKLTPPVIKRKSTRCIIV